MIRNVGVSANSNNTRQPAFGARNYNPEELKALLQTIREEGNEGRLLVDNFSIRAQRNQEGGIDLKTTENLGKPRKMGFIERVMAGPCDFFGVPYPKEEPVKKIVKVISTRPRWSLSSKPQPQRVFNSYVQPVFVNSQLQHELRRPFDDLERAISGSNNELEASFSPSIPKEEAEDHLSRVIKLVKERFGPKTKKS